MNPQIKNKFWLKIFSSFLLRLVQQKLFQLVSRSKQERCSFSVASYESLHCDGFSYIEIMWQKRSFDWQISRSWKFNWLIFLEIQLSIRVTLRNRWPQCGAVVIPRWVDDIARFLQESVGEVIRRCGGQRNRSRRTQNRTAKEKKTSIKFQGCFLTPFCSHM